uniref:hypothetical protein n=1 Tax=Paractinoplanes polyasparticus TaxID=2856853 RepID=UPI001C856190|nr:hypothetical protein [Actinoplanes polyasparticus]
MIDQYGLDGPIGSDRLESSVVYSGAGLRVFVHFNDDTHDSAGKRISVAVHLDTGKAKVWADLDDLVESAVFAPRHRVASKAHTGDALRATLDDNALWIRRLWPILREPEAIELFRDANRFESDKGGNPKRRPKNIKWKYP